MKAIGKRFDSPMMEVLILTRKLLVAVVGEELSFRCLAIFVSGSSRLNSHCHEFIINGQILKNRVSESISYLIV